MNNYENLNILSKKEIIEFCKTHPFGFKPPTIGEVAYFKWNKQAREIQKLMDAHIKESKQLEPQHKEIAKEIDRLAVKVNNTDDIDEKLKIIEKRGVLLKELQEFHAVFSELIKEAEINDKWYEQYRD